MKDPITVETQLNVSRDRAWEVYTNPEYIKKWNNASDDWHTTEASNDVQVGGKFNSRMEAKDGSAGFNFTGVYTEVVPGERLAYTMDDGRKATIDFTEEDGGTHIVVMFEPEHENSPEMQKGGWQAILDSYKKSAEE